MYKCFLSVIIVFLLFGCTINREQIDNAPQSIAIFQPNENLEIIELGNDWYELTESVQIVNITPEKAQEIAISKASNRAIDYYSGVEISGRTVKIHSATQDTVLLDNLTSLITKTSRGIIIDKEIISENNVIIDNQVYIVVTLKLKVGKQKGERDPAFTITGEINREYFQNGEEMKISVKSSQDCYLTILNVCSNDSVYVIFPNQYRKENFIKAGEEFLLPDMKKNRIGLTYPVSLLPDKTEDTEIIKVLATKQKIDFSSVYTFSAYGTYKSALMDLQKWLLKIPRSEIEEIDMQYFIKE